MNSPRQQTTRLEAGRLRDRAGTWRAIEVLGVLLIITATALLGSVAWQLWGTGIATSYDQQRLAQQFNAAVRDQRAGPVAGSSQPPAGTQSPSAEAVPAPASSQPALPAPRVFGLLVIPRIGVHYYVVEGVGSSQLAEGPGHYPGTAAIGAAGNVGIAGHRTTHGAPFYRLNELRAGDLIYLTNTAGQMFTYRVTTQFVVAPSDGAVLNATPRPTLTLTTCNPRYSAAQRLIVQAILVG